MNSIKLFLMQLMKLTTKYLKILILKQLSMNLISSQLLKKDYINLENKETIENKIYNSRKDKIEILEDNGTFIFYQIDNIQSKLPNLNDDKFIKQITNLLFQKEKFEFNKDILDQLDKKNLMKYLLINLEMVKLKKFN